MLVYISVHTIVKLTLKKVLLLLYNLDPTATHRRHYYVAKVQLPASHRRPIGDMSQAGRRQAYPIVISGGFSSTQSIIPFDWFRTVT